jgi:methenyltetrahydromethanopterin cyclohydrolase
VHTFQLWLGLRLFIKVKNWSYRAFDYFWCCISADNIDFRDIILGFVASVQVAINDMVRIGDWITMGNLVQTEM